jgi:hypothetical protein
MGFKGNDEFPLTSSLYLDDCSFIFLDVPIFFGRSIWEELKCFFVVR